MKGFTKKTIMEILNADKTQKQGTVPFHPILMQFAAAFIGKTYTEFMKDHKILVESNLRCHERFETDAVSVISDPFRETSAFGADVEFRGDFPPVCKEYVVKNDQDVRHLKNPDVHKHERTLDRILGVRHYRSLLPDKIPVIGWVEGPLAEACDLAGVTEVLINILLKPDWIRHLMDVCLITAKDFAFAQIEAGSSIIGVGDAICSQISAVHYREFVLPLHQDLFSFIHEKNGFVKLHICGNIMHLLADLDKTGVDILDLDWMVNMNMARGILSRDTVLCGQLDPVQCIEKRTSETVYRESLRLMDGQKNYPFILSGGCEITRDTPHENLLSMSMAAHGLDINKPGRSDS